MTPRRQPQRAAGREALRDDPGLLGYRPAPLRRMAAGIGNGDRRGCRGVGASADDNGHHGWHCRSPGTGPSSPRTACLRHWLRVEAVTPWRVATTLTEAPGTKLSAMIKALPESGQRQRLGLRSGSHGRASASSWSPSATPVAARETPSSKSLQESSASWRALKAKIAGRGTVARYGLKMTLTIHASFETFFRDSLSTYDSVVHLNGRTRPVGLDRHLT